MDRPHERGARSTDGHETMMRILHAVDRPLDQLTVGDICVRCGISRQTFYRYFKSKDDISIWYTSYSRRLTLDQMGRTLGCYDSYCAHFAMLRQERDFLCHSSAGGDVPARRWGTSSLRESTLLETLACWHGIEADDELRFDIQFFVYGEAEMGRRWFASRMEEEPSSYARKMVSAMPPRLRQLLEGAGESA